MGVLIMKWDVFDEIGNKIGEISENISDSNGGEIFTVLFWILLLVFVVIAVIIWPMIIYAYIIEQSYPFDNLFIWFCSFPIISTICWFFSNKINNTKNQIFYVYIINVFLGFIFSLPLPADVKMSAPWMIFLSIELSFGSTLFGNLISKLLVKIF